MDERPLTRPGADRAQRQRAARPPIFAVLCVVAVTVFGVWLISPRFDISGPSLIDDWASIHRAPRAVDALLGLHYVSGTRPDVDSDARYRPAFTAVWNSLQWRTFGAPNDLTGPNVWNVLRLALFVAGLAAVALAVSAGPLGRRGPPGRGTLALASVPPALVLATPALPTDFARFGPQEQLLVGGMALGGLLMLWALARSIATPAPRRRGVVLPAVAGYALWLLGVYFKEASICFLVLAPFLYLFLDRRWREGGLTDRPLWRYRQFQLASALLLLPVLHVGAVAVRIAHHGTTAYGTKAATGLSGLRSAFHTQWSLMSGSLATPLWKDLALALPVAVVLTALARRRVPWLAAGIVLTAYALLVFQGLGGASATRYYIPVIALLALAAVLLLADAAAPIGAAALVAALLFVVNEAQGAHDVAATWAAAEQADARVVDAVTGLNPKRCPVYQSGLDLERATALPVLVGLRDPTGPCNRTFRAVLVNAPPAREMTGPLATACRAPGWRPIRRQDGVMLFGCRRLGGGAGRRMLEANRLRPE